MLFDCFDRFQVFILIALLHQIASQIFSRLTRELTHDHPLIAFSRLIATLSYHNAVELINGCVISIDFFFLAHSVSFFLLLSDDVFQLPETGLINNSKRIEEPNIAVECWVAIADIQIQNPAAIFILKVGIGYNNKIDRIELLRFPLDVAVIGRSNDVLLFLMVENDAVVVMLHHFHVFF